MLQPLERKRPGQVGSVDFYHCLRPEHDCLPRISRLQELEQQAGQLSEAERAALLTRLLATLPPLLVETDGGVAEARQRDAELDANPSAGLTDQQFRAVIAASREH